jgi:hypothetical protein
MCIAAFECVIDVLTEPVSDRDVGVCSFTEPEFEAFHYIEGSIRTAEEHKIDELFLELSIHIDVVSIELENRV